MQRCGAEGDGARVTTDGTSILSRPAMMGADAHIARLFELSTDLLATLDREGRFRRLNPSWEQALGWSMAELIGTRAVDLVHTDDLAGTLELNGPAGTTGAGVVAFENRYRCKDDGYRWLQWNARLADDTWFAVARDVTERRSLEQQAIQDPLTGLVNRPGFMVSVTHALSCLRRRPGVVGVLFVDLDGFKVINDGRGHEVGDRFLRAVAQALKDAVRGADTVARLGGDEFVVLVENGASPTDTVLVGERVVAALARPIAIDGDELAIGASVGIGMTSSADTTAEALLREADIAMYRAKARGGGRYEVFDEATRAEVALRVQAEDDLRHAIDLGQLVLHYQPVVALPETSITRCEALVRWQHPTRGLLPPAAFIPLAEETGLIVQIGAWVVQQACAQAQAWRRAGNDVGITVNVSTRQLDNVGLVDVVRQALEDTGLPPGSLCLEITETEMMNRPDAVAPTLAPLKALGVRIAMDDFGTGHSSLTYLKHLPLDIIKIDRSFIAGIIDNAQDHAIVSTILNLARQTEMSVIAEGVETEALHAELVGLGCEFAQGYLYGRPEPADRLTLDGYSSCVRAGVGDPLVIREFMRQIGIPARIRP